MALVRPCPTDASPAAAGLYLQSVAMDLEDEFTRIARGFQGGFTQNALLNAQIVRRTSNLAFGVGISGPIWDSGITFDFIQSPSTGAEDWAGLWRFGFNVRTNAAGVEDNDTQRSVTLNAIYTDSTGTVVTLASILDRVFEPQATATNQLSATGEFVMPDGTGQLVAFTSLFSHGNTSSAINVLANSYMWAYRVSANTRIETVS